MTRLLVATPQSTIDSLMREQDRQRLGTVAETIWRNDLTNKSSAEDYSKAVADTRAEIVMTGWGSPLLTPAIMKDNPALKYAVNVSGTVKAYVARECIESGLIVTNWGDVPAASVAEAALMMTLASLRKAYYSQVRLHEQKLWRGDDVRWQAEGLFDKTVGLYGFGVIARAFTRMLKPFDVRILVFSSYIDEHDRETYGVNPVGTLRDLFADSDIVSVHTGNRPDTFHTVNAGVLSAMKDGGHIINTARGAIIDTDALAAELKTGRLFAALDVFEQEPLPVDHPLRGLPNCLLFPHEGGPTVDYRWRCGRHAVDQVERYVRGEPLKHVITADQYDRIT